MSRDCFIAPRGRPMVNRSFSSHYYDYPMGRVPRGVDKGVGWKKHGFSSPCPESAGPIYLPGPSCVGPCPSVWNNIADAPTIEAAKSNFFPFIDPFLDPLLEREVTHAMRHMPSPLAVRVCKYFGGALCLRAAPYSPRYPRVHKRSRSNSHPVRNFYFSIGCETTKRVTPY